MTRCPYRADKECKTKSHSNEFCQFCLMGQQADEMSLMNSAIANLTASIEERLCREEQIAQICFVHKGSMECSK